MQSAAPRGLEEFTLPASAKFSAFVTTRRNEVLDLIANITIFPAYLISSEQIISRVWGIFENQFPNFNINGYAIGLLLALLPVISISGLDAHWRLGMKGRKRVSAVAIAIFLYFFYSQQKLMITIFFITFFGLLLEFLIRRILARRKHKHLRANIRNIFLGFIGVIVLLLWAAFATHLLMFQKSSSPFLNSALFDVFGWLMFIIIGIASLIVGYFGVKESWRSFREENTSLIQKNIYKLVINYLLRLAHRVTVYSIIVGIIWILGVFLKNLFEPYSSVYVSVFGLTTLLLVAGPSEIFSRQVANFRSIVKPLRANSIYSLISPSIWEANPFIKATRKIRLFIQQNLIWLLIASVWVIFGFLLPYYLLELDVEATLVQVFPEGIIISVVLSVFIFIFWLLTIRPKHFVIPFTTVGKKDSALEVIANLTTQAFVEKIRHIYILLNMKQVENLSLRNDGGLAFFVTSGQDQEFVEQIRALGNVETAQIKLPFGDFLLPFIKELAATRIRGTVQRQEDNSVVIWIEYIERGGRTVAVDAAVLQERIAEEINKDVINSVAYALAVKLVHKLGHHAHLASSWESLKLFLDGLNETYVHNWWRAISFFQKVVELEDSVRSGFGYGYYQLGAILMFQGDIAKGMEYLYHAEKVGPPLAETQYMLALGKFSMLTDYLHTERIQFEDIKYRCEAALTLRPDFPEARHLLGSIYYQRGRLRERALTFSYRNNREELRAVDPDARDFVTDYILARKYFLSALKHYDIAIRRLPNDILALSTIFDERTRVVQDRMAATHRLGDTLRSLGRFSEANSYYREVLIAYPRNNRTLLDLAKTFTMAKTWQKAFEFLATEVLIYDELAWNKSVNFYRGWSLLGGLAEQNDKALKVLDLAIHSYTKLLNPGRNINHIDNNILYSTAMDCLDFAYHQYPGYLYRWHQLDWISELDSASKEFSSAQGDLDQSEEIYNSVLGKDKYHAIQFRYWLAWRAFANIYGDSKLMDLIKDIVGKPVDFDNKTPYQDGFGEVFTGLKKLRQEYEVILEQDYEDSSIKNLMRRKKCLNLAMRGNGFWEKANKKIEEKLSSTDTTNEITFGIRWAIDVYAELALFTIKALVEAKGYEFASSIAKKSAKNLKKVREHMAKACQECQVVPPGNKVVEYQLASLYAWNAYTSYMQMQDIPTQARLYLRGKFDEPDNEKIDEIQTSIKNSMDIVKFHPLAMYSYSLLNKKIGLFRQAADEFSKLATVISPFDPHRFVSAGRMGSPTVANVPEISKFIEELPISLYKRERVSGRKQFDYVVNMTQIHINLADIFTSLGEVDLATGHIMHAISKSPYSDITARLFFNLVNALNHKERFNDALAALVEAKNLHLHLSPFKNKTARCHGPFVLEVVLNSNLGNFSVSLEKALQLRDVIQRGVDIYFRHETLRQEILDIYSGEHELILSPIRKLLDDHLKIIRPANNKSKDGNLAKRAAMCLSPELLFDELMSVYQAESEEEIPLESILVSQILGLLARDIFDHLIYWCDIQNNIAFNLAELNYLLEDAEAFSKDSIDIMEKVFKNSFSSDSKLTMLNGSSTQGSATTKRLQNVIDPFIHYSLSYEDRLANYYDTKAWIFFRKDTSDSLEKADDLLVTKALQYGADLPVIYFHLAQITKRKIELIWLGRNTNKHLQPTALLNLNSMMQKFDFYLQELQRLDSHKTLHSRTRQMKISMDRLKDVLRENKIYWL